MFPFELQQLCAGQPGAISTLFHYYFFFLAFLFVEILHCYHLEIIGLSLLSLLAAAG